MTLEKQKIGKTYKKDAKPLGAFFDSIEEDQKAALQKEMADNGLIKINLEGKDFELSNEFIKFET